MQLDVAHTFLLAIIAAKDVSDVLPLGSPYYIVAELLHLALELRLAFALLHAMVNSNAKLDLPTVPVDRGAVFLGIGA